MFHRESGQKSIKKIVKRGLAVFIASALVLSGCGMSDIGDIVTKLGENLPINNDEQNVEAPEKEPIEANDNKKPNIATGSNENVTKPQTSSGEDEIEADDKEPEQGTDSIYGENIEESVADSSKLSELTVYSDEQLASAGANVAGRYAYELLNSDEKTVYKQMYLALMDMSSGARLSTVDVALIQKVFSCVYMDNPEIFWANGYIYVQYALGNDIEAIGFSGSYTISAEERANRQSRIDAVVANCLSGAPAGDDYAKIKYVYEYIVKNTEYDLNSVDNQNICSVFLNQRSVCQGYAKATQYLLNRLGIRSTVVSGTVTSGEPHAWNLVYADGAYYYVDATWGDATYQTSEGFSGKTPSVTYDYLCVPDSELFRTHRINDVVPMPTCTSMADNYFVRESCYFTGVNEDQLLNLFNNARAQGKEMVTGKCSDSNVYSAMKQYLVNDQNIFKYIGEGKTVSYFLRDDQYYIGFWL